ncbi:hypothetical protein HUC23_23815, partial [Escherichia coli]|nr:hypothetical protein [Escherichia coli]
METRKEKKEKKKKEKKKKRGEKKKKRKKKKKKEGGRMKTMESVKEAGFAYKQKMRTRQLIRVSAGLFPNITTSIVVAISYGLLPKLA